MSDSEDKGILSKILQAHSDLPTVDAAQFEILNDEYLESTDIALQEYFGFSQLLSHGINDLDIVAGDFARTDRRNAQVIATSAFTPPFSFLQGMPTPALVVDGAVSGTISRAAAADATTGIIELAAGIGTLGTASHPSIATPPIFASGASASLMGLVPVPPSLHSASVLFQHTARVEVDFQLPAGMGQYFSLGSLPGNQLSYRLEASGSSNVRVSGSLGVRLETSQKSSWNAEPFLGRRREAGQFAIVGAPDLGGIRTVAAEIPLVANTASLEIRGMIVAEIRESTEEAFAGIDLQEPAPVTRSGPVVRPSPLADGVPPGEFGFPEGGAFGNYQRGGIVISAIRVAIIREQNPFGGIVET